MKNVSFKSEDDMCSLQSFVSLVIGDYWAQPKQENHWPQRESETYEKCYFRVCITTLPIAQIT